MRNRFLHALFIIKEIRLHPSVRWDIILEIQSIRKTSGRDIPPMSKWENIDAFFVAVSEYYDARVKRSKPT